MNPLNEIIQKTLSSKKSVLLIGPTDSGKTWYVKNELIPYLNNQSLSASYFENPDEFINSGNDTNSVDACIFDEVETFEDKNLLTNKYGDGYYSSEYVKKTTSWIKAFSFVKAPSVFIVTRNKRDEIDYLITNTHQLDWGTDVICLEFKRQND